MNRTKVIADVFYRDRMLRARRTSMTQKLFDGGIYSAYQLNWLSQVSSFLMKSRSLAMS